ncbi:MAG: urease subunit beta [Chloroflexota bacterium]
MIPGELVTVPGTVVVNSGRRTVSIHVENTSVWPVHVGSHFHFFEANKRLRFDRAAAYGMRLDIAAGATVRWEPGETKEVRLVEVAGAREIHGFNGLVDGPLSQAGLQAALRRARDRGFLDSALP